MATCLSINEDLDPISVFRPDFVLCVFCGYSLIILLVLVSFVNSLAVSSKNPVFFLSLFYSLCLTSFCCKQRNVLYFGFYEEILAEVEWVLKAGKSNKGGVESLRF